jgi:hypothetical protein
MTAQTVREIAASSFTDAIEMLGLVEVLEAGNQRPTIQALKRSWCGTSRRAYYTSPVHAAAFSRRKGLR